MKNTRIIDNYAFAFIGAILMLFYSCEKDNGTNEPKNAPILSTKEISNITKTKASTGGIIIDDKGFTVIARGVCWSTNENPTIKDKKTDDGAGAGNFTSSVTDLEPDTRYYVRAYATNSEGTGYGMAMSFTTNHDPIITTTEVTEISHTNAQSGGIIIDYGGSYVFSRGICWSTNQDPTFNDNKNESISNFDNFTCFIHGLKAGTTYYVRAYAYSDYGIVYGNNVSFSSLEVSVPILSSLEISGITKSSAITGGNITYESGSPIIARGVCWSTSPNPTISNSKTEDGTGIGNFISNITGLQSNTIYYLRAYATNSGGTGYGNSVSFKTFKDSVVDDNEGNVYSTVVIGNQEWFTKNLKTTKYNDGTPIPNGTSYSDWENLKSGSFVWYENNEANFKDNYGALYNWYAVGTGKLCPKGWHVPTKEEWYVLIRYLGSEENAGGKLKSVSTVPDAHPRWNSPNKGATDEYGFSALPGGYRGLDGTFYDLGKYSISQTFIFQKTVTRPLFR